MWPYDTGTSSTAFEGTSNSYTWSSWNSQTATCVSSGNTWSYWVADTAGEGTIDCSGTDVTLTADGSYIWTVWIDSSEEYTGTIRINDPVQEEYIQIDQEENNRRYEEMQEKKKEAEKVARDLLMELIGEKELQTYNETKRLFVKGKKFDYLLSQEGKVQRLEKDKVVDLCIHLREKYSYPNTDNLIGLKLLIEDNEEEFNEKANIMWNHDRSDDYQVPRSACGGI